MTKVFFKPWVGDNYGPDGMFGKKILVVAKNHICDGCGDCGKTEMAKECAEFTTTECIEKLLAGEAGKWGNSFKKFERSLVNYETKPEDTRKIWHSLAFYNYVQTTSTDGPRKDPAWEDFRDSADAFFEVLDDLKPDLILVWGVTTMYDNLPGERWEDGNPLTVEGRPIKNGYYQLANGNKARVLWVYDPSWGYSWDHWHKVIATEVTVKP